MRRVPRRASAGRRCGGLALPVAASALLALGALPAGAAAQELQVEAPEAFLSGIGFVVTVRAPGSLDSVAAVLRTVDGTVLGEQIVPPLGEALFHDVVVPSREVLPLLVTAGDARVEIERPVIPGWFSILPPLVAIVLALVFREVVISLFVGVWVGMVFLLGFTPFYNPIVAIWRTIDRFVQPALADADHAAIVVFSLLLGGMVGVITRMGGTQAIVAAVTRLATTARRAQVATWLAGLAIFFDDYANTLLVGNTMRPLTDKLRVSREKLAYIVDSTAAPVAAIVFVSTWVGYEISLIDGGLEIAAQQAASPAAAAALAEASPFAVFLRSLPYSFYPILAIVAVALFALSRRDFGPMLAAERRAAAGEGVFRPGAQLAADMDSELRGPPDGAPLRWWNGVLPVLLVVVTVIWGLVWTGMRGLDAEAAGPEGFVEIVRYVVNNADPFAPLLWGSAVGCITGVILASAQRILTPAEAIAGVVSGMRAMAVAMVILVLAWSLGGVTEALSTANFLAGLLSDRLPLTLLPAAVFLVAAVMAFATGTSWATMAILIPLILPLSVALGASLDGGPATGVLLGSTASVLAGAIFGDHCSPISDTTVLSSMASGCDHIDHVRTQLPYALTVAGLALVGLLLVGTLFGASARAALAFLVVASGVLYLVIRGLGRPVPEGGGD